MTPKKKTKLNLPLPDPKLVIKISSHHHEKQSIHKPGQTTPKSGQYQIVGPKGGKTGGEITAVEGKPLPPTPKPGQGYILVDKTKHNDEK